ncbi:MAG: hypothetical protein MUF42_09340 [Cytophagaceae bacterium]|jgi:hypothetical protein|nr:hypothetical protein [Cytophagaceae bacterium]
MNRRLLYILILTFSFVLSGLQCPAKAEVVKVEKSGSSTEQVVIKAPTDALIPFSQLDLTAPVEVTFALMYAPLVAETLHSQYFSDFSVGYFKLLFTRIQPSQAP